MLPDLRLALLKKRGPFAIDGTPVTANNTGATSVALAGVSTVYANDIIIVAVIGNGFPFLTPIATDLSFTRHPSVIPPNNGTTGCDLFYAIARKPINNITITAPQTSTAFITAVCFAISGAKIASPFDVNSAIPTVQSANPPTGTISTNAPETIAFGVASTNVDRSSGTSYSRLPTVGATANTNYLYLGYRFVTAPLAANLWLNGSASCSISTAIVKAP